MARRVLREKQTMTMSVIAHIVLGMAVLLGRRQRSSGDSLPTKGGFIVALNHLSVADPPLASAFVYDNGWYPRFLAKSELFRTWPLGSLLRAVGQIPVQRRSSRAAESLTAAADSLALGRCVVIFPEGTTTKREDLWPMPMKSGAVRLAITTGAPIIPVALWGTHKSLPWKPLRRPRVSYAVGAPLDLSAYAGKQGEPAALRAATADLHAELTRLLSTLREEQPPSDISAQPADSPMANDESGETSG